MRPLAPNYELTTTLSSARNNSLATLGVMAGSESDSVRGFQSPRNLVDKVGSLMKEAPPPQISSSAASFATIEQKRQQAPAALKVPKLHLENNSNNNNTLWQYFPAADCR